MEHSKILLDSGNNEVEILEINVGGQCYGVNVLKIKQILQFQPEQLSAPPKAANSVVGLLYLQGQQVPVINLSEYFGKKSLDKDRKIVIVLEFNETWYGFLTDDINKIHRMPWSDMQPLDENLHLEYIIGTTIISEKTILIIDFEKVVSDIFAQNAFQIGDLIENGELQVIEQRKKKKVVYVDDSSLIRESVAKMLVKSHYSNLSLFKNGQEAFDYIMNHGQIDILVTDIEMPIMDGLTLCKRVKEKDMNFPVIVLSSLISKQVLNKCKMVNADAAISKKNMPEVISMLDELCLKTVNA